MEQIKAFIEKANTNSELMTKLDALGAKNVGAEDFIALAAEYGFTFTEQEYEQAKTHTRAKTGELSEEDLDAVSGGGTENRYNEERCREYKYSKRCEMGNEGIWERFWCINRPCDHYRDEGGRHWCVMGCF